MIGILLLICIVGVMLVSMHLGESPTKDDRCRGGHDF